MRRFGMVHDAKTRYGLGACTVIIAYLAIILYVPLAATHCPVLCGVAPLPTHVHLADVAPSLHSMNFFGFWSIIIKIRYQAAFVVSTFIIDWYVRHALRWHSPAPFSHNYCFYYCC